MIQIKQIITEKLPLMTQIKRIKTDKIFKKKSV